MEFEFTHQSLGKIKVCDFDPKNVADLNKLLLDSKDYYLLTEGQEPTLDSGHKLLTELPEGIEEEAKHVLGIYLHNRLAGVIDVVSDYNFKGEWWLGLLLIHPNFRGQALGRSVIESLSDYLRSLGATDLSLAVVKKNSQALKFWRRVGFTITKEEERLIAGKKQAVVFMGKSMGQFAEEGVAV